MKRVCRQIGFAYGPNRGAMLKKAGRQPRKQRDQIGALASVFAPGRLDVGKWQVKTNVAPKTMLCGCCHGKASRCEN